MFVDVRGSVRRFTPGDYTLMHDGARDTAFATLDLMLHLGASSLEEKHGGQTVYVVGRGRGVRNKTLLHPCGRCSWA